MAEEKRFDSKKALIFMGWLLAVSALFTWIGTKASIPVSTDITIEGGSALSACLWDIVPFVLVSITGCKIRALVASVLLSLRGFALGTAACFCAVNAVPVASVAMILSYVMVSILLLIYSVVLFRGASDRRTISAVYLLITGAVVIIRILPLVLIK